MPAEWRGYDPARMRRAIKLGCVKLGPRQYRVQGTIEKYYDVALDTDPACYCLDQRHRGEMCKHEICARLHDGDEKLVMALGQMLLKAEQQAEAQAKRTRQRRAS